MKAAVRPDLLRWARERASRSPEALAKSVGVSEKRVAAWEGSGELTLKQLEKVAKATHTPVGYLFLSEPPVERLPIPDFRSRRRQDAAPSPELLDVVYLCQRRQAWFRENETISGGTPLPFVGSARLDQPVEAVAQWIRGDVGYSLQDQREAATWTDALRAFIQAADDAGILVMCSGIVQNDTHRKLDPGEFRGFALSDDLAPLVFINGADTKAAQMFTLAHELAHIWLGRTALSDDSPRQGSDHEVERWCNKVAAEFLLPMAAVREEVRPGGEPLKEARRFASAFKVSSLVALVRLREAGFLGTEEFNRLYEQELADLLGRPRGGGGDFYLTQSARLSRRFARALVVSALEGRTLYREAMSLVGISKLETFHQLGRKLGIQT
jgi:Zn-dependent peptidase ImmA (M78 family)